MLKTEHRTAKVPLLVYSFLFQFQLSCPYAALGQELVQTLGLFSPLETFHPVGAGFNGH